jgi:CHAT domain-containing protein
VANCLTVAWIDGRYQVFASGKSVETWTAASHTRQAGQELLESVQARRDEPTVRSLAMAFSKALLGDRWASLDKSTGVSIAVDAGASALPFGLLTDSTGKYLALQTELSLAIRRPAKAEIPTISRIALAGLQSAMHFRTKRFSNLPEVNGELEDIHGSFPLARMWNRQQGLEDFVRGELAWAQSFHFAGHAVLSGDTNVILLGDGRLLTPGTASTLDWSGISLVTLSACGTASDGMLGYFNPASLVRSFLDRNAESVLATNWAVDSSSNREWMRVFYRVLAQGESIHRAQLSAKKALFANPIHSHPSHWAGYLIYT